MDTKHIVVLICGCHSDKCKQLYQSGKHRRPEGSNVKGHLCVLAQNGSLAHESFNSDVELKGKWVFICDVGWIALWQGLDRQIIYIWKNIHIFLCCSCFSTMPAVCVKDFMGPTLVSRYVVLVTASFFHKISIFQMMHHMQR